MINPPSVSALWVRQWRLSGGEKIDKPVLCLGSVGSTAATIWGRED
ncbi:MAG: hypothetical protein P5702_21605 [Limnospira sp. PMC 1291.21]|nr:MULTISPECIES: hypothetical protein [unclassified Limnospira]MDC0840165.1 hypothetical protein [Limnoraphis robusta]MDT9190419.1 hypothetical protein [Limnospira sp. PMC 894.15]MDT9241500.1 hypothetical protein [Limnospira sp. PMC 1261.20]MDT9323208.1 hypothetical protein [Limnospira sp. PMC 1290.21]MDT9180269.1 hypothetical protein [Limnospira sp. PMC 1238.20]